MVTTTCLAEDNDIKEVGVQITKRKSARTGNHALTIAMPPHRHFLRVDDTLLDALLNRCSCTINQLVQECVIGLLITLKYGNGGTMISAVGPWLTVPRMTTETES